MLNKYLQVVKNLQDFFSGLDHSGSKMENNWFESNYSLFCKAEEFG